MKHMLWVACVEWRPVTLCYRGTGTSVRLLFTALIFVKITAKFCYVRSGTKFSEKSLISPIQTAAASLRNM